MTHQIHIHTPANGVKEELAEVLQHHWQVADVDDCEWAAKRALHNEVTLLHTKPGLEDAIKSCGLATFVSITSLD